MPHHNWVEAIGKFAGDHPEVLLTLLVAPAHFLWGRYNVDSRKRSLRQGIAELIEHRESIAKLSGLAQAQRILEDIENDLKAAVSELATTCAHGDVHRKLALRSTLSQWFLLYKPSGPLAWIFHALFFANVMIMILGFIGSVTPWDANSKDALVGVAFLLIPAYFLQWLARRASTAHSVRAPAPT